MPRPKRPTRGNGTYTGGGSGDGGGGIAGIISSLSGGTDGGPTTISDQPLDEGELEAGTVDGTSIDGNKYATRVVAQPYTLRHPIWDAISGGKNAFRVAGLNSQMQDQALLQQNALDLQQSGSDLAAQRETDRLNLEDKLKRRVVDDRNFEVGSTIDALHNDKFAKEHGFSLSPDSSAMTGRKASVLYGANLPANGLYTAQNLSDNALFTQPFVKDLATSKAQSDIEGNIADKEGNVNRAFTATAGRPFITPTAQTNFDVSQSAGGASIAKNNLAKNIDDSDLYFNRTNQPLIDKQKRDQMALTGLNLDRMKKIIASEKMQTIPVDTDHHILYDPETKDAVLIGSQMNPKDPMNPIITTKHWSMEHNGEIMPNGMIKRSDGTIINPKAVVNPKDGNGNGTQKTPPKKPKAKNTYTGGSEFGKVGDYINGLIDSANDTNKPALRYNFGY